MHRPWRHPGYQLVHVTLDGVRHPVGTVLSLWPDALARAERMVATLRAEVSRGNADAGGEVWIVDTRDGTIVERFSLAGDEAAGQ